MAASLRKLLPSPQTIFQYAPAFMRRVLVNMEAKRRDSFRRYGNYAEEVRRFDPAWYRQTSRAAQEQYQLARLREIVAEARAHVGWYRQNLPEGELRTLDDLRRLPIVEKDMIRADRAAFVRDGLKKRDLWLHSTSGSTGAPLYYYHDRPTTRSHQAVADAILADLGCRVGLPRARISGVSVVPVTQTKPPFWIYIDHYQQLQFSAYHLSPATYPLYLKAMRDARIAYGTGYPSAWHLLAAYILESGDTPPALKAIVTDSEGISFEQQALVERAFGCPLYQTYGTGEVQQVAQQCNRRRYHVLTKSAIIEILDDDGNPVRPGETGQVIVTDLISATAPFIRYRTGDLATLEESPCDCGCHSPALSAIVGRLDDRIRTPEGRWVRIGGHIIRPAIGVKESQIVQVALDHVVVRVVPAPNFVPASMEDVLAAGRQYLGNSVRVTWEQVDALPRTKAGKLRHVVREI
jgi:phenylacetate-CoA ligase